MLTAFVMALVQVAAPQETLDLAFRWPAEGSVLVHETRVERSLRLRIDYVLRWAPAQKPGQRIVRTTDVNVVDVVYAGSGEPVPAWRRTDVAAVAGAIPTLRVDEHGTLLECFDLGQVSRTSAASACDDRGELLCRKLADLTSIESLQDGAKLRATEAWNGWVSLWSDWHATIRVLDTVERKRELGHIAGLEPRQTLRRVDQIARRVERTDGASTVQVTAKVQTVEWIVDNGCAYPAFSWPFLDEESDMGFTIVTDATATLDQATLLPQSVSLSAVTHWTSDAGRVDSDRNERTFIFDWSARVPPDAPPRDR